MDPKERIPAEWPPLDAREILRRLTASGIDFVVIGGIAIVLLGYPRITRDLDIVFAFDDENLEALGRLLVEMKAQLRGVKADVGFVPDRRTLQGVELLTLNTALGWFDVHRLPAGVPSYARLRRQAERVNLDDFTVFVANPDDLIAMKEAANRPQDRIDIAALETIKRLREQQT